MDDRSLLDRLTEAQQLRGGVALYWPLLRSQRVPEPISVEVEVVDTRQRYGHVEILARFPSGNTHWIRNWTATTQHSPHG